MTPDELRAYMRVMKEEGGFKVTIGDTTIEMSGAAIAQAAMERAPKPAPPQSADGPSPQDPKERPEDHEDPMLYAASEGLPG